MNLFLADPGASFKFLQNEFGQLPNFNIVRASKGQFSALDLLYECEYDFDAALISLIQPRGDGITLTEELRKGERIRNRPRPIDVYWISEREINESNTADSLVIAKTLNDVKGVFVKPLELKEIIWNLKGLYQ